MMIRIRARIMQILNDKCLNKTKINKLFKNNNNNCQEVILKIAIMMMMMIMIINQIIYRLLVKTKTLRRQIHNMKIINSKTLLYKAMNIRN